MKRIVTIFYFFFSVLTVKAQYTDWVYLKRTQGITSMANDENLLWIGHHAGVVRFDKTTGISTFFDKTNCGIIDDWVSTIAIDGLGNKWFGTQGAGLSKYDGTTWTNYDTSNSGLLYPGVQSLATDASNNLWVTTSYTLAGVVKFDGTTWTSYNTSNSGLPSNIIKSIYADGDTIWLSTYSGLAKFDGTTWTVYNTSNSSISSSMANAIEKDGDGNLWLMHYTNLEKFDGNNFTIHSIPSGLNNYSMTIDTNNIVWTGCSGSGIPGGALSFDGVTWTKYDSVNSPFTDDVGVVLADNSNTMWIGGDQNGKLHKKNGSSWTNYNLSKSELNDESIYSIAVDVNGKAYINSNPSPYTGSTLVSYDWSSWSSMNYTNTIYTTKMISDKQGNILIKNSDGISKYNGSSWSMVPGTPTLNLPASVSGSVFLWSIATDTSNGIWIDYLQGITSTIDTSTWTTYYQGHEGLAYYDGSAWTTYNYLNSPLPDAHIGCVRTDRNNVLWASVQGYGFVKFDGSVWTNYNTTNSCLPTNNIGIFTIDTTGAVWYTDQHFGFNKFDGLTCTNYPHPTLNPYSGEASDIETDLDGSIWQIGLFYLFHFDGSTWTTFEANNSPLTAFFNTRTLTIDRFGNKWIGTGAGVFVYKEGGVVMTLPMEEDEVFSSNAIFPNPFQDAFEINLSQEYNDLELTIYDVIGRIVYQNNYGKENYLRVLRNDLRSGVYLYQLRSEGNVIEKGKIIAK